MEKDESKRGKAKHKCVSSTSEKKPDRESSSVKVKSKGSERTSGKDSVETARVWK